ncbi:MAG: sugar ABC transporter ATP-binding protein [Kiritimatiellae bacterium]|nr:sugar ABC transporter ATP-binding protein [Kiritimatiellia bacterium]
MRDLRKRFGPTVALDGVSFSVKAGEVRALVGENGAGKSTLMKILSGALAADSGEMRLEGDVFAPRNPREARAAGVGMIYQELSLAPHLSIADNIFLGCELRRRGMLDLRGMRERARKVMRRSGLESVSPDTPVRSLSAAQCQQVELARALASGCRILVLDEPTSSLTKPEVERLFSLIRAWRAEGLAIVYISHFLEEVREIADSCTVLCDGRGVLTREMAALSDEEIVRAMVGRDVEDLYQRSARGPGETVLEVDAPHASVSLRRGEILGIAGLIGSGRTEWLEGVFGLRPLSGGEVRLHGRSGRPAPGRSWRRGAGFLSEDRKRQGLALNLSVADNLLLSRLPAWSAPERRQELSQTWISGLGIKCAAPSVPVQALSGGNQQKVALARLLHHGADVLLLDEPTRGIDVGAKARIYEVLNDLARGGEGRQPCAILLVSSYLPELLGMCDRIAVMRRGRLGEARPVADWNEHLLMEEAVRR